MKKTQEKCFTLIELLVVIAVIAITTNSSISVNALFFD
ncbi:MAG: prepilin-type N-terminal cleavage/methylation domain-containing protein [Lentisphaerae bacterium]|nr:prepilin-type N-terminal cleavage/methylation domain-containing protein [Lentisphaerota bacterium]